MKVLISDVDASHAASVLAALSAGYGSDLASETVARINTGLNIDMQYARLNGIGLVIRSTTGVYPNGAAIYYPDVQLVQPLGSNSSILITAPTSVPVIVLTGAGDDANETGYGPGLEFFAPDPVTIEPDRSSFSNGYIAGQLLAVKEGRGGSWWNARYSARKTASGGGSRTDADGYGKIDVDAAIAYSGQIATDTYLDQTAGYADPEPTEEGSPLGLTSTTKTLVDALTLDPANTEANLGSHATHHDVIHTALQELYGTKTYVAKITQEDTGVPTSTQLVNTTGVTFSWTREDVGEYRLVASSTFFIAAKTFIMFGAPQSSGMDACATYQNGTTILVETFSAGSKADNLLGLFLYIKVEVYS